MFKFLALVTVASISLTYGKHSRHHSYHGSKNIPDLNVPSDFQFTQKCVKYFDVKWTQKQIDLKVETSTKYSSTLNKFMVVKRYNYGTKEDDVETSLSLVSENLYKIFNNYSDGLCFADTHAL